MKPNTRSELRRTAIFRSVIVRCCPVYAGYASMMYNSLIDDGLVLRRQRLLPVKMNEPLIHGRPNFLAKVTTVTAGWFADRTWNT